MNGVHSRQISSHHPVCDYLDPSHYQSLTKRTQASNERLKKEIKNYMRQILISQQGQKRIEGKAKLIIEEKECEEQNSQYFGLYKASQLHKSQAKTPIYRVQSLDRQKQHVKQIVKEMKNMKESEFNSKMQEVAQRYGLPAYQLRIWIAALKIIIKIEQLNKKQLLNDSQLMDEIKKGVLEYMLKEKKEKKYKIVKLVHFLFHNFTINEAKIGHWVNLLVYENMQTLKHIDFSQYAEKQKTLSKFTKQQRILRAERGKGFDIEINFSIGEKKSVKGFSERSTGKFPPLFRRKVSSMLDHKINEAFKEQAKAACIPEKALRSIYSEFWDNLAMKSMEDSLI